MSKRYNKDQNLSNISKKPKLQLQNSNNEEKKSKAVVSDDVWGDDFADEDIEVMDLVASQACSQDVIEVPRRSTVLPTTSQVTAMATTSAAGRKDSMQKYRTSKMEKFYDESSNSSMNTHNSFLPQSQKLASSNNAKEMADWNGTILFQDFEKKICRQESLNSTFVAPQGNPKTGVMESDDLLVSELKKLKVENKKLMDNFVTKEGETAYLRNQLLHLQQKAENERKEKLRLLEEEKKRHKTEIDALFKEKENLQSLLDLKNLEVNNMSQRQKLLESGSIRLAEPRMINMNSPNRSRLNSSFNRASPSTSNRNKSVQINATRRNLRECKLGRHPDYCPLFQVPNSIFEPSLPEKCVVDIQYVEKIGKKRNLPSLQEEETFRIFENPDLVKPIVTVIDGTKLDVQFFLADFSILVKKTAEEIEAKDCIPIINKLIITTRELLLNNTIVLETILKAMKNDDIRDMNDVYFSEFYKTPISHSKTIFDSKAWQEKERGIEARRAVGVISHVASISSYLSGYISGRNPLIEDENSHSYSLKMKSYNKWQRKGCRFEILEIILQFATSVCLVRRSHQFVGLICAIAEMLSSVQRRIGFCNEGIKYVSQIFQQLIFSRPLSGCFIPLTRMLTTFSACREFVRRLCSKPKSTEGLLTLWKNILHFSPDTCVLEIYITQLKYFHLDPVAKISIADSLLSFANDALAMDAIPNEHTACKCYYNLVIFVTNFLCNVLKFKPGDLTKFCETIHEKEQETLQKQLRIARNVIRFLSYLAIRDPNCCITYMDVQDSFHLLVQRIWDNQGLLINENDQEALGVIKSTLTFDKRMRLTGNGSNESERSSNSRTSEAEFGRERRPMVVKISGSRSKNKFGNFRNKIYCSKIFATKKRRK